MSDATAQALIDDLALLADPERAAGSLRFFQSGPDQYGEGDRFLGISVPILRAAVKPHRSLSAAGFLEAHAAAMSATTLTYACERLTAAQRDRFRALRRAG